MSRIEWTSRHMSPDAIRSIFGGNVEPCPFCGASNVALLCTHEPHVTCMECGADGPTKRRGFSFDRVSTDPRHAQATAVILWNERP